MFDVALVPELAHIDLLPPLGLGSHVESNQLPQLFNFEFVQPVLLFLFLQNHKLLLFLQLLLLKLKVDRSYLFLPKSLILPAFLL